MDRLPDFNGVVAYPALLVPHKIPSKEGAILPYFPNLVEAISGEFNATPFVMAHNITIDEILTKVAFKIWPHSIKLSSDQTDRHDITSETFCKTQIISQQSRGQELDLTTAFDASLLAMENLLYYRLLTSIQDQSVGLYAHMNILEHACGVHSTTKPPTPTTQDSSDITPSIGNAQPFQEQEPPEPPRAASNLKPPVDETAHLQDQEPFFKLHSHSKPPTPTTQESSDLIPSTGNTQPFHEQEPPESPRAASNDNLHIQEQKPSFQLHSNSNTPTPTTQDLCHLVPSTGNTQPFHEQEPPESPRAASNLEPSIDDTAHIQYQEPSFQIQQWIYDTEHNHEESV
jgi:hypothetical protein